MYFYTFNTLKRALVMGKPRPAKDLLMGMISGEGANKSLCSIQYVDVHGPISLEVMRVNTSEASICLHGYKGFTLLKNDCNNE